jgi:hypothetical protein
MGQVKMGRKAVMFSKTLNQGSKRYMAVTGGTVIMPKMGDEK